jgi:serine/threonine-protein kinase ULK/ATG1
MLNVLKFLKDNGLIHRDLKPENIMVIKDSNKKTIVDVKLIDFGFAVYQCSLKTKSGDHLCVGTINYVAPEILSMDETFDYKVDMFSLGVVVFNM